MKKILGLFLIPGIAAVFLASGASVVVQEPNHPSSDSQTNIVMHVKAIVPDDSLSPPTIGLSPLLLLALLAALVLAALYNDKTKAGKKMESGIDDTLASVMEKAESKTARFLLRHSIWALLLLVLVGLLVLSPLVVFFENQTDGKDWSDLVKNVIETAAVLCGLVAVFKWVNERQNRATDILLQLTGKFETRELIEGKQLVDDNDRYKTVAAIELEKGVDNRKVYQPIDNLLDFYILIYAVRQARQVPDESLSTCFRYWLAHYFRKDRVAFREYVDKFYPTLKAWLQDDVKSKKGFFKPEAMFSEDLLEPALVGDGTK